MGKVRAWKVLVALIVGGCAQGSADAALDAGVDPPIVVEDASTEHDARAVDSSGGRANADASADDASIEDAVSAAHEDATITADAELADSAIDSAVDSAIPDVNLAPLGRGFTWQSMTSSSANTGRMPSSAVNDDSLTTQANIDNASGDNVNAWQAAGAVFTSAHTITLVRFVQGTTGSGSGDGWFEANLALQFSTDGSTWNDSGWSVAPAYAYSSAVSGKTYTMSGAPAAGVMGVRIAGQVNTVGHSWWAAVTEVITMGH
jgi:hypothetical protein